MTGILATGTRPARKTEDLRIEVPARPPARPDEDEDPQTRAYNEYLAWLREHPDAPTRPGSGAT